MNGTIGSRWEDACLTISAVVVFVTPESVDDCMRVLSIIAAWDLADRFDGVSREMLRFTSVCC